VKPYYQDNLTTLYHGDCLEVMAGLPAQSFDAVISDPPYGSTNCAWDSPIPFAPMWTELKRLIKPRAAIVLFGSQPFTSALVMSNPKMFGYEIIWDKKLSTGYLDANRKPLKRHENILFFYEGRTTYNPIMRKGAVRAKGGMKAPSPIYSKSNSTLKFNSDDYYPTSILEIGNTEREGLHPTQKPLPLMEYLIRTYTNEGDTILDFTAGSGTTLRAAKNLGRRAVGIEKEADYCAVCVDRLAPKFEDAIPAHVNDYAGTLFEGL
jgi:site-specific DNA-methyltransferase (adenine-specific)